MAWVALVSSWPDFTTTLMPGLACWKSSTTPWMALASRPVKKCQRTTVPDTLAEGEGSGEADVVGAAPAALVGPPGPAFDELPLPPHAVKVNATATTEATAEVLRRRAVTEL